MAAIRCKCGHRKSKHSFYPPDWPFCKGIELPKWHIDACPCEEYDDTGNLERLEWLYSRRVNKNVKR